MAKLLKVLSVLEMIFGVLGFLVAMLFFLGGGIMGNAGESEPEHVLVVGFAVIGIVMLLSAVFNFACGYFGWKGAAGYQRKLSTAIKLGWIGLALAIISAFMTVYGEVNAQSILSALASAVIPVLFLISAISVKKEIK